MENPKTELNNISNYDKYINNLLNVKNHKKERILNSIEIRNILRKSKDIILSQPVFLQIDAPIKVCGDVHGQFTDLIRIFELCGLPPNSNYIFLGDYVDRGKQSIETICLLLLFKIKYPNNFFLLRGNHECASINRAYGFYDECKKKYSIKLWKAFIDVFNCLPFSALLEEKIMFVHGGLSPYLQDLKQISQIERPLDVPDYGLECDLLWSDPEDNRIGWKKNDRGISFIFNSKIVEEFILKHNLCLIVRAHQVVCSGYEFFAERRLVTVFSAPNYCSNINNRGAILVIDENLKCSFKFVKPLKTNLKEGAQLKK